MSKFKVGDIVEVKNPEAIYNAYTMMAKMMSLQNFHEMCSPMTGDVCTVIAEEIHPRYSETLYGIKDKDGREFIIGERGIELIKCNGVDASGYPLNFTDDMLKPFMRVKQRGRFCYLMVCNDSINSKDEALMARRMNSSYGRTEYDVMEVYEAPSGVNDQLRLEYKGDLLWKRVEAIVETSEQKAVRELEESIKASQVKLEALKLTMK